MEWRSEAHSAAACRVYTVGSLPNDVPHCKRVTAPILQKRSTTNKKVCLCCRGCLPTPGKQVCCWQTPQLEVLSQSSQANHSHVLRTYSCTAAIDSLSQFSCYHLSSRILHKGSLATDVFSLVGSHSHDLHRRIAGKLWHNDSSQELATAFAMR